MDATSREVGKRLLLENSAERLRGLVRLGWDLLRAGRSREAGLAFGRVLLRDPAHAEARRGLAEARSKTAESGNDLETRFDDASSALEAGERQRAQALIEDIMAQGGDSGRVLALLDRLDTREGRISAALARDAGTSAPAAAVGRARRAWPRRLLVFGWSLLFASMAAGVAASWDRLVGGLVRPPVPESGLPLVTEIPTSTPGERALLQAQLLLDEKDPVGAVAALDRVPADDPAYPFSRRLRSDALTAARPSDDCGGQRGRDSPPALAAHCPGLP